MSTILNNERLDAIMADVLLTPEESMDFTLEVIDAPGVIHHYAVHPERLEKHVDAIHEMLLELGKEYQPFDQETNPTGGGMSFLNMCLTAAGEQWTGLHNQQEKLYSLGIASGWAVCTFPQKFWPLLHGNMPYLSVLAERKPVTERTTIGQMLKDSTASSTQEGIVTVATPKCVHCGRPGEVKMPEEAYKKWQAGEFVQRAWPEGSAGDREQLINGTHPKCFNEMFPPEEEY